MRKYNAACAALATAAAIAGMPVNMTAQGLVTFINIGGIAPVRTNATGLGGGAGYTSIIPNGFAYGLFIAPSTVISVSPLDLLTATWTFTGVYAVNTTTRYGGVNGGSGIPVPGWDNVTNSYAIAGWSANVAGMDWNSVAAQLNGASFTNGGWSGPNWLSTSSGGFFGVSAVGYGEAPDPSRAIPALPLFGSGPTLLGVPISTGWDLFVVIPEPSATAVGCLGGIILLIRRHLR